MILLCEHPAPRGMRERPINACGLACADPGHPARLEIKKTAGTAESIAQQKVPAHSHRTGKRRGSPRFFLTYDYARSTLPGVETPGCYQASLRDAVALCWFSRH